MTARLTPHEARRVALRATLNEFIILLAFALTGQWIFRFFSISTDSLRSVGGGHPSYLERQLVSLLMMVAASALLLLALLVASVAGVVRASWFAEVVEQRRGLAVLGSVAFRWSSTLLLIFVAGLIFYFVPNTKVRFRDVWPGAILTGLLWRGALLGFSWYVRDLSRFSVHGSIATVVVFLLWVYVSAVILLYGVEFTAAFAELLGDQAAARREQDAAAPA